MSQLIRRDLVRAACRIAAALRADAHPPPLLPLAAWRRLETLERLLVECHDRGWPHARRRCQERLVRALGELRCQIDEPISELSESSGRRTATLRELYDELRALAHEFAEVRVKLGESLVTVVTEPIVLEGMELGPFEIELSWRRRASSPFAYLVRAQAPCPAAHDDSLVHPHVRDEQLCEGDGWAAIRRALGDGRLLDFFTIVAQTLATYNAQSAYASLDHWRGVACADCGDQVGDATRCERCDALLCEDCACGCARCGRTACGACGAPCVACHEHCCPSCLERCSSCQEDFCERCCDEGECSECRAAGEAEERADSPPSSLPVGPVHPLRLGQTSLPP
jgi:hypothetical protein